MENQTPLHIYNIDLSKIVQYKPEKLEIKNEGHMLCGGLNKKNTSASLSKDDAKLQRQTMAIFRKHIEQEKNRTKKQFPKAIEMEAKDTNIANIENTKNKENLSLIGNSKPRKESPIKSGNRAKQILIQNLIAGKSKSMKFLPGDKVAIPEKEKGLFEIGGDGIKTFDPEGKCSLQGKFGASLYATQQPFVLQEGEPGIDGLINKLEGGKGKQSELEKKSTGRPTSAVAAFGSGSARLVKTQQQKNAEKEESRRNIFQNMKSNWKVVQPLKNLSGYKSKMGQLAIEAPKKEDNALDFFNSGACVTTQKSLAENKKSTNGINSQEKAENEDLFGFEEEDMGNQGDQAMQLGMPGDTQNKSSQPPKPQKAAGSTPAIKNEEEIMSSVADLVVSKSSQSSKRFAEVYERFLKVQKEKNKSKKKPTKEVTPVARNLDEVILQSSSIPNEKQTEIKGKVRVRVNCWMKRADERRKKKIDEAFPPKKQFTRVPTAQVKKNEEQAEVVTTLLSEYTKKFPESKKIVHNIITAKESQKSLHTEEDKTIINLQTRTDKFEKKKPKVKSMAKASYLEPKSVENVNKIVDKKKQELYEKQNVQKEEYKHPWILYDSDDDFWFTGNIVD